jgi:hypothetical protein
LGYRSAVWPQYRDGQCQPHLQHQQEGWRHQLQQRYGRRAMHPRVRQRWHGGRR